MSLKKYAELGHVYRTEPCQEYPGTYFSYVNGNEEKAFTTLGAARVDAHTRWANSDDPDCETAVCWKASDNDPRIGEVWFTGFYQIGRWDVFGRWKES